MKNLLLPLLFVLISCQEQKLKADLLLVNANIYTVDAGFTSATAFAVKDGAFIAVGSSENILETYTSDQTVDADGATVIPGIIDAHCHFFELGMNQQNVNLEGSRSWEEVLTRVQDFHDRDPAGFIMGRGWDQNDWETKAYPEKTQLDSLFPSIPVVLERIDGHAYMVNQRALDLAGINQHTKAVGGEILKRGGVLTGILIDGPMKLISAIIPTSNLESRIAALKAAEQLCIQNGLTTVNDAGLDREIIQLIDSLQQTGELLMRVYAMVSNEPSNLDYYLKIGPIKTPKLNVRSIKVYADGALGSRGAVLKDPYTDQVGHFGAMVTSIEEIDSLAKKIAASDYQMNTHAIGDSANAVVLRAYSKALKGQTDRRWKIEHAQVVDNQDLSYYKEGVIPSVQPTHATSDMYWAEDRLGTERLKEAYAFKTLMRSAGIVALGTDFPVEQVSPFLTFYAAVARKDIQDFPSGGFFIEEALSREEALKGMTIWAAYSNFEENEKGSIETGKVADFVVLSDDIMQIPLEALPEVKATQVYIDGKKVNKP